MDRIALILHTIVARRLGLLAPPNSPHLIRDAPVPAEATQ